MYIAEIQGKLSSENENKEDILTSNVFSFFKYTDRQVFLYPLLKDLDLDITPDEAVDAQFDFWPSYEDGTEPDLVILVGAYYVLFEAKYFSGFGNKHGKLRHQLVREIEEGYLEAKNRELIFRLIVVTKHYVKPDIFRIVPDHHRKDISWINWQQITKLVHVSLEKYQFISAETRIFANDLYKLLLKKNLRKYDGRSLHSFEQKLKEHPDKIFLKAETATYRDDFLGFIETLQVQLSLVQLPQTIFFYSQ